MSFEVSFLSRNMKDDPTGRQLYQLLTSMHDVFEQIREKISQLTELEGKLLSMRRNLQLFSLGLLTLEFTEPTPKEGISILKAISLAMVLLQRCEFKLNHEAWFNTVKHRIGVRNSSQVLAVVNATQDNIKSLYKVRAEMRSALNSHLKIF
ncbi:outer envelope protein 64, mitochondrial-like isoform X2 [Zingiber officinale]|uniref:outer envelope protein 64, mitochondrial-like isoform X2 n=1 Tax=Zingiber officinale TaxID=94328 RepID=UPI001C4D158D|nr:outer envelope protein 64, mitochondrial-like isoform X2 [Zingiber officinale]